MARQMPIAILAYSSSICFCTFHVLHLFSGLPTRSLSFYSLAFRHQKMFPTLFLPFVLLPSANVLCISTLYKFLLRKRCSCQRRVHIALFCCSFSSYPIILVLWYTWGCVFPIYPPTLVNYPRITGRPQRSGAVSTGIRFGIEPTLILLIVGTDILLLGLLEGFGNPTLIIIQPLEFAGLRNLFPGW